MEEFGVGEDLSVELFVDIVFEVFGNHVENALALFRGFVRFFIDVVEVVVHF